MAVALIITGNAVEVAGATWFHHLGGLCRPSDRRLA